MSSIYLNIWPEAILVTVGCVLLLFGTSKNAAVTHWRGTVSAVPSAPFITMPPTC